MPAPTTWWVALVAAGIALLGAWGAQVVAGINGRRESVREGQREARAHWRDRRLETYAEFHRAADDALERLKRELGLHHLASASDFREAHERMDRAYATLDMIGTDDAVNRAFEVKVKLSMPWVRKDFDDQTAYHTSDREEDVENAGDALRRAREEFRRDLDIIDAPERRATRVALPWRRGPGKTAPTPKRFPHKSA